MSLILRVFFALSCLFAKIPAEDPSEVRARGEPGFFLTFPKTLLAGRNETICLSLSDCALPAKALLDLKVKDRHHTVTKIMHSDHSCFEIRVPAHNSSEAVAASLHLQIQLNGTISSAHGPDAILIYPGSDVTFVESDRAVYKQGEKIRIRILVLTPEFKPSRNPISNVKIVNPKGFIVSSWDKLTPDVGFVQLDYQLTDDAILGKWRVESNGVGKQVHVKRHVLPRFKATVAAPKSIYARDDEIQFVVCAKYSFNKPVKGVGLVKITYADLSQNSSTRIGWLQDGCVTITFTNQELNLSAPSNSKKSHWLLKAVVTVTEHGTNQIESEAFSVDVKAYPYKLAFAQDTPFFQPGLPYRGRLRLLEGRPRAKRDQVEICYQISVRKMWNLKGIECGIFDIEGDGTVYFNIPPLKDSVVAVKLTARSLNYSDPNVGDTFVLHKWHSPSNSYIYIDRSVKPLSNCKSTQQFTIYYTTNRLKPHDNVTFYYMVKSKNEILQVRKIHHTPRRQLVNFRDEVGGGFVGGEHRFAKGESYVDKFILKFKLHGRILWRAQLLVYYFIRGEVVANGVEIPVEKCLPNAVKTSWSSGQMYPGELATLSIATSNDSLCAVSSVDISSTFAGNSKPLTVGSILQPFLQGREPKVSYKPNCLSNQKKKQDLKQPVFEDLRRRRRSTQTLTSGDFDVFEAFSNAGLSVISNMKLIAKPCVQDAESFTVHVNAATSPYYDVSGEDRGVSIRSFFPATWLWELVPIGQSGVAKISRYLPHTITTWVSNVVCVSPTDGVAVADKQEVVAFQPFFVDLLTPLSIKRHETLHLQVSIFNYMNYSLPIRLTLGDVPGLEFLEDPENRKVSACIKSNDVETRTFMVKGIRLGPVNVTVLAEIESMYPRECGPETILNKRDVVYKSLLVEPEGFVSEFSKSALICGNDDSNNVTWTVTLPTETVKDSKSAKLIFNTDLMGPTINNLEKFLNVPTGCGEQIMSVMAPNLYILKYLKANSKLTPVIRQRAVKNLKIGYQRILDHAHNDGSFSAFGYYDNAGSMFLTAFVVRTLKQATDYIYIDRNVILKATDWIVDHQLENGCFSAVSHVFQDMGGTSMENSTAALTAYVMIGLLESGLELSDSVKTNAIYCMRGQYNADKYTLAITAYALYLLGWEAEANKYLERLLDVATRDGKMMWWSNQSGSASTNIEMTGYVLMSLIFTGSQENLVHASSVVRWLGTQRSASGGFVTSQDTSVALDAMSRYGTAVKNKDAELSIKVRTTTQNYEFAVHKTDRLKTKEIQLNSVPETVEITAEGDGCLLAQLSVNYNVNRMTSSEAFRLKVDVNPVSTIDKCSIRIISPCISYVGLGHSNMAVLEVSMPSGFEPDRSSLYKLTEEANSRVKKFEDYSNRVVLYFTELTSELVCVPFNINENILVEDHVNTSVKIYDYYKPELTTFVSYQLKECQNNDVNLDYPAKAVPIVKRDVKSHRHKNQGTNYGLNKAFVNVNYDMATPSGLEGNLPTYVKVNDNHLKKLRN